MCDQSYFVKARRKQSTVVVSESPTSVLYNRRMIDCCGITQIIVMNNKKKKIQLMEDDWLKDLQGDVNTHMDVRWFQDV
jgi:hypothetical protein